MKTRWIVLVALVAASSLGCSVSSPDAPADGEPEGAESAVTVPSVSEYWVGGGSPVAMILRAGVPTESPCLLKFRVLAKPRNSATYYEVFANDKITGYILPSTARVRTDTVVNNTRPFASGVDGIRFEMTPAIAGTACRTFVGGPVLYADASTTSSRRVIGNNDFIRGLPLPKATGCNTAWAVTSKRYDGSTTLPHKDITMTVKGFTPASWDEGTGTGKKHHTMCGYYSSVPLWRADFTSQVTVTFEGFDLR